MYNHNTKEDGVIGRAYKSYISDWAEDVLQLSSNERLRSATLKGASCL